MRVADGRLIALGYGKYFRSDRIIGIDPIKETRGPGRRTKVYVQDLPEPIIASRSAEAILRDITHSPEEVARAHQQRQLLTDILETIDGVNPVLRSIIREQARWDLNLLEERIRDSLGNVRGGSTPEPRPKGERTTST